MDERTSGVRSEVCQVNTKVSLVARYGYSISFYVHWCSCEGIDFTTVRDADELKMFAWDNEDVQPHNAGVVRGLARSGQIETL